MQILFLVLPLLLSAFEHCQAGTVNENAVEIIQQYMDLSEDPCDDFFSYACGNWSNFHKSGRYSESTGLIDHKINKKFLGLFKATQSNGDGDSLLQTVMTFFKSCRRDRKQRNIRYLKLVKPAAGLNWPLLEKLQEKTWPKEKFNWLLAVANLRRYGLNNAFMEQIVTQNLTNSSQYVIDLDKPNLTGNELPNVLVMLSRLVELGLTTEYALNVAEQVTELESKISSLLEIEDEYGVLMPSLHDIEDDLRNLPWRKYFEILVGQPVNGDYVFQIRNFAYFMKLPELLAKTPPEVICNYLMFKFLSNLMLDRSSSADKVDCMVDVRSKMDLAMNFIYAERFFSKDAETYNNDVQELIGIIRTEFRKKLLKNHLSLSSAQIKFLERKLDAMDLNMGNMPKNVDRQFVERYYQQIVLRPRDYYHNHLALLNLRFEKEHEVLVKGSPDPDDFFFVADSDTARSSTPFYLVRRNLIVVPYGFLQTPIYHHNMLNVLKYSLFGFNVAHEIAHAFDASGVLFDLKGTIQDVGNAITENDKFTEALACMQRDETTSLDERVADLVGLRLAYDAYFQSDASRGESDLFTTRNSGLKEKKLEKVFFLNFAQFFCGNMASEFMDHDSDNVRLQQTLLNFEPFAETFQCDLGSTMNPEMKCRLWTFQGGDYRSDNYTETWDLNLAPREPQAIEV